MTPTHSSQWKFWLPAALFALGCSEQTPVVQVSAPVALDSAGIVIAVTPRHVLDTLPVWSTGDDPEVVLGNRADPAHEFYRIAGAAFDAQETIVVVNGGTLEVRWFDRDGSLRTSAGRHGRGPGEFSSSLLTLQQAGHDTLVVHDMMAGRLTYFSWAGEFLGVRELPDRLSGFVGLLSDGTALTAAPELNHHRGAGLVSLPLIVQAVNPETGDRRTIATVGNRQEVSTLFGEKVVTAAVPFTALGSAAVADTFVLVVDGSAPEVRLYDGNSSLRRIHRVDLPAVAVDRRAWENALGVAIAAYPATQQAALRRGLEGAGRPTQRPFFDRVLAGPEGRVLARLYHVPGESQEWLVFDEAGRAVQRLVMPSDVRLRQIAGACVLGVRTDELGVERVEVHCTG